jgi:hypothetical protein
MVSSGLNELETPIRQACNLAKALLIMSSGENIPPDEGEGAGGSGRQPGVPERGDPLADRDVAQYGGREPRQTETEEAEIVN